jgi:hypothetical protein
MLQHINEDWFNEKIRQTEDGKASVLDLIRNAISGRGERMVWKRLKEQYPEVEALVDDVTLRDDVGRLNKPTPVVDLNGWLEILALLPGAAGKKYRKAAADLVVRVWKGDAMLGLEIMLRDADSKNVARAKRRIRVTDFNKKVTAAALTNNEQPNRVHDARYKGFYYKHIGKVRNEMGLKKADCPLDYMEDGDLAEHEVIQFRALAALKNKGGRLQAHVFKIARAQSESYERDTGLKPALPHATDVGFMDPKMARAISASHEAGQLGLFAS